MKSREAVKKSTSRRTVRPTFPPISKEMRHWSTMLETEMDSWPGVTTKPRFGFLSFYRRGVIFAAILRSRGLHSSSSLILKFDPMPPALFHRARLEPRIDTSTKLTGRGWFSFELFSEADLRDALWWLGQAYECSKRRRGASAPR